MAQIVRTGLFQHLSWADPAVGTWTSCGTVTGGSVAIAPNSQKIIGISGLEVRKGGVITPSGSATFYITETNVDILTDYGVRADYPRGGLEYIDFRGGLDEFYWTFDNALIGSFSIDWAVGEILSSTIDWQSLGIAESTVALESSDYPTESESPFADYECVLKLEDTEYAVQSLNISVNNNVSVHSSGDEKTAGSIRFPERFLVGAEELTVGISTALPIPSSVLGTYVDCAVEDIGITVVCTNACTNDTFTITLTDLMQIEPSSMSIVDHTTGAAFDYGFAGKSSTGSITMSYVAAT